MTLLKRTLLVVFICLLSQSQAISQAMVNILIQNQGPCTVDIYDYVNFQEVFETILDPGQSYATTVPDGTTLRAKSSPATFNTTELLFDESFTFSVINNTWIVSSNYCNPSCTITCPQNVSLNSGDPLDPIIHGEPTTNCNDYSFTYTDSNVVNGTMTRNWVGNYSPTGLCGDIANDLVVRYRHNTCADLNNSFVGGVYLPTQEYNHDCATVTSSGISLGSGLLDCTPYAVNSVYLNVDADDDCNGFAGDQMGSDTDNDLVSLSFHINPTVGLFRVNSVLVRHWAPEFVLGNNVTNNRPQQLYARMYRGSVLLYDFSVAIPTTSDITIFPINTCIDVPTTYTLELLPSCPMNSSTSDPQIWQFSAPGLSGGCPEGVNYPTITCSQQFTFDCDNQDLNFVSGNPYPDGNFLNGESEYFITDGNISANNIIDGGANITYDSDNCVELNTGFEVKSQAVFEALIDGCN